MKKTILISIFFLILSFTVHRAALGNLVSSGGLEFSVANVSIITPDDGTSPYLTLDFQIYNATETRKIDLTEILKFSLTDEFNNKYSRIREFPEDSSTKYSSQSIYPKKNFIKQLAFELPVARAVKAELQFDGSSLGIEEPVVVSFSLPRSQNVMAVKITDPQTETVVEQGALIHLDVMVSGPRLPDSIVIDAFHWTYEDQAPSMENIYDLNVPSDFDVGPQNVNVIVKWKKNANDDVAISSDSVILNVKAPSPINVL